MSDFELINRRLDVIQKNQEIILFRLNDLAITIAGHKPKDWIDSLEVQEILHISASTLYRRRKKGALVPRPVGGSYLYYAPDIYNLRNHYLK